MPYSWEGSILTSVNLYEFFEPDICGHMLESRAPKGPEDTLQSPFSPEAEEDSRRLAGGARARSVEGAYSFEGIVATSQGAA